MIQVIQQGAAAFRPLVQPHSRIDDPKTQLNSRLLSLLILVTLAAAGLVYLFMALFTPHMFNNPDAGYSLMAAGVVAVAYVLNRFAGLYRISLAMLLFSELAIFVVTPFMPGAQPVTMAFTMLVFLTAGIFLRLRYVVVLVVSVLTLLTLLTLITPGLNVDAVAAVLEFLFVASALTLTLLWHLQHTESIRRQELETVNDLLTQSEALLERRVQDRTRDLHIAMDVAKEITTVQELDKLLSKLVQVMQRGFSLPYTAVYLYDPDSATLVLHASSHDIRADERPQLTLTEAGLVPLAARRRQIVLVNDSDRSAETIDRRDLPDVRAELVVPILYGARMVGVLDLQSTEPNSFSDDDVRIMNSLADQIAIAVYNVQLFETLQSVQRETEVLYRIGEAINNAATYPEILNALSRFFHVPDVNMSLALFENSSYELATYGVIVARRDAHAAAAHALERRLGIEAFLSLTPNSYVAFEDFAREQERVEFARFMLDRGVRAGAAVPLYLGQRHIGSLLLSSPEPRRFAASEMRLLTAVSDVVAAAVERTRLFNEQVQAAETLRTVDRIKSQFLASMSHELRTPLNAILNFTEFVAVGMLGPVNERQKDALTKSLDSGRLLLALINDVLDMTKIEAGMMRLSVESNVDLRDVIREAASSAQALIRTDAVELRIEVNGDLPGVSIDRRRIQQVLLNLLSNAAKFTDNGSIVISAYRQHGEVQVCVRDTGVGIAPEDHDMIFEPFSQTADGSKHAFSTGLGLAISKRLVHAHGGRMWVVSAPGDGAAFHFTLPVTPPKISTGKLQPKEDGQPHGQV